MFDVNYLQDEAIVNERRVLQTYGLMPHDHDPLGLSRDSDERPDACAATPMEDDADTISAVTPMEDGYDFP